MIRQCVKMILQTVILPFAYWVFHWKNIRSGLVVFADAHHNSVPESMELLVRQAKSCPELTVTEVYRDYQACSALKSLCYSISFMKLYAQASCVVLCDNFLPVSACRKKQGTAVLQLWHACGAYKKFGYDTSDDIPTYYRGNVFRNYDTVCVSGNPCIAPFSSAMRQPEGVVQPLGIPRTDLFFDTAYRSRCQQQFLTDYPFARGKKILLWAPTFRGNASAPLLTGIAEICELQHTLGEEWLVVAKLHPHMRASVPELFTAPKTSCYSLLLFADFLVTDYSSIFFDFILEPRPMVFWVPDLEEYQQKRGFYLNFDTLPGAVVTEAGKLFAAVKAEYTQFDPRRITSFSANYMSACDGRVCQRLITKITEQSLRTTE